jgi:predicted nucleotide-binding protein
MPYYHVIVGLKSRPHKGAIGANLLEQDLVSTIVRPYNKGEPFTCGDVVVSQDDISYMRITESEGILSRDTHWLSPQTYFANLWQTISQQEDVTEKFLKTLLQEKKEKVEETKPFSKNIFIVHGRDHAPMKELKTMLYEFGFNPIVLHEKASGGLTLAEKLEKYSDSVGYAFVILTPDDAGSQISEVEDLKSRLESPPFLGIIAFGREQCARISPDFIRKEFERLKPRARQNAIFEMGYFWGLLKRKRVCCLLKGDVEKPSDIEGIVYIPFKNSINEVQVKIMKELKEAGYEIKL